MVKHSVTHSGSHKVNLSTTKATNNDKTFTRVSVHMNIFNSIKTLSVSVSTEQIKRNLNLFRSL